MKKMLLILLCVLPIVAADLDLSPSITDNALSVIANPAGLATYRNANMALRSGFHPDSGMEGGLSIKGFGLGFYSKNGIRAFYLANGFRLGRGLSIGMRTGYVDTERDDYYNYDIGFLYRPFSFLSLGVATDNFIHGGVDEVTAMTASVAVRPVEFATIHYDMTHINQTLFPAVGAEFDLGGLVLTGKAELKSEFYSAGLSFSLPNFQGGALFPINKKKGEGRFSVWVGVDRKSSIVPLPGQTAVIEISGEFLDIYPEFSLFGGAGAQPLGRVLTQLRNAANDEDIRSIILKIGNIQSGLGMVEEIRNAILDLRIAGKRVVCYLDDVELLEYYLACAGDEIVVAPGGAWMVAGVRAEITFFKGTLDKIGVKAEFQRVGEYKSAVEPFTRDSISPAFRENEEALLKSVFDHLVDGIANARDIERQKVLEAIDLGNLSLKEAVDKGFINRTGYFNQLLTELSPKRESGVNLEERSYYTTGWRMKKRIVVIAATGTIVPGESFTDILSGEVFMGSETIAKFLKNVRRDPGVKAVVFRINSGGGSGVASDIIWHEVEELKKVGKPVIVSIGDVAASGGYYIACNADTIVSDAGSIVGSIGVFTGKFVLKGLYDKIGIKKEIIKFGRNADVFSDYHEFTDEQRIQIQTAINEFYDGFITKVAQGRKMTKEHVDSLGKGRVYTGIQAKELGLVDVIGDLADALDIAKSKAGFKDSENPDIEIFPKRKGFFQNMMEEESETKAAQSFVRMLTIMNNQKVMAIMPYRLKIE
ncbi:MAG: signal peptide peptidase SppA [Elusimicrobia bacterium RIFOXYB2_FULL_49_7]|nr:MAG: signal peptide peptidase SppA [Elusimicrobia bacterium RIFOXYB2_FULL_49_7]